MRDKAEAKKALIKMFAEFVKIPTLEFEKGIDKDSPYSKVYWFYQDVVNFMDQQNQAKTESWLDQVKERVEHPTSYGFDMIRVRDQLEMAIIQMGHGLDVDWNKERTY